MQVETTDDKIISIMEFLSCYDDSISMQSLFSGHSFYKLLISINDPDFDFTMNLETNATKWFNRLLNMLQLVQKIEQYFEVVHDKFLDTSRVDFIALCKEEGIGEIVSMFEIIMCLVMESKGKDAHIQKIMQMRESSQEYFVSIIKHALEPTNFTDRRHPRCLLKQLIQAFQEQTIDMQRQIKRLCQANFDLLTKIEEEHSIVQQLQSELKEKKNNLDSSNQQDINVRYLEAYIDKLKERIVLNMKDFEEHKSKCSAQIAELEQKICREEEFTSLNSIYKEKYEEIMDQMQKMNIWKKQKAKLEKNMQEKNFVIHKLHERIEELSDRNLVLQEKQLDFNLQIEKKNIKIKNLSQELKKAIGGISHYSHEGMPSLDQSYSFKENVSFLGDEQDEIYKLKKNNDKILRDNKHYQKQIARLEKKCEKLRFLEEDKKRLELLVYELRTNQTEQLNLLTTVFYEGYKESMDIKKSFKPCALDYISDKNQRKKERSLSNVSDQKIKKASHFNTTDYNE